MLLSTLYYSMRSGNSCFFSLKRYYTRIITVYTINTVMYNAWKIVVLILFLLLLVLLVVVVVVVWFRSVYMLFVLFLCTYCLYAQFIWIRRKSQISRRTFIHTSVLFINRFEVVCSRE